MTQESVGPVNQGVQGALARYGFGRSPVQPGKAVIQPAQAVVFILVYLSQR